MKTEKDLLLELQQGSAGAFEELFHRYGGKLYNFVLKLSSGNKYLAEEMVQNTFVRVWEIRVSINPDKSFISYLCTIAKNKLVNEYEHQTVEYIYKEYVLKHYSNADNITEKEVDKKLLEDYIDCLIDKMPPARKQVFILSRKAMLSNKEIAAQLNISESTVQTHLSKAVLYMKEQISKYYDHILSILLLAVFIN